MSIYAKLARSAAEHFVLTQELLPMPFNLPPEALQQRACYVSVYENPGHRLRSIYGEPLPRQSKVAQEIITNTVSAITQPRARHIRRADLTSLSYGVALLGPMQRINDPEHLDPQVAGLYLRSATGKTAVLLPQRAGVETPQDQIATALRESQVDARREEYSMYRFTVIQYDG